MYPYPNTGIISGVQAKPKCTSFVLFATICVFVWVLYPRHTYFESAGIKQNQPSRNEEFSKFAPHSEGNFKPSHTRGGMSRNDGGMEIINIFLDHAIRRGSELRPDSFEGQSGRSDWIRAAFERQSKDSDDIWISFQLNSCNIEIDSGSNRNAFEVHSGSFEAHSGHSGRIWSGLPFRFSFEGDQNVSNAVEMP